MLNLPPQVDLALERLAAAGYEAFLVGGAVRDYVRDGSPAKDWDITTNATPEQLKQVFSGYHLIETGLKHGTLTVRIDHVSLEITTYRGSDGSGQPEANLPFEGLRADVERRDFTMNALAYHPKLGVVDLVGGKTDIENGVVRCVGTPDCRFQEDGLRILRALRFASIYELRVEVCTAAAIHRNRNLLRNVAVERIRSELTKLLCGAAAGQILREFADVIAVPLPELSPMFGFAQQNPHHDRDVWEHTLAVVDSISPEPTLRWAALLHDAGKPACFSIGPDGLGHFYGHAAQSTAIAEQIMGRLRFDKASRERIIRLIRYHDMPITADRKLLRRLLSRHGAEVTRQLIALHRADACGQSPLCQPRLAILDEAAELIDDLLDEEACFSLKNLALRGGELVSLGFRGKEIGAALQACLRAVVEEQLPNEHAALLAFAKSLLDESPGNE